MSKTYNFWEKPSGGWTIHITGRPILQPTIEEGINYLTVRDEDKLRGKACSFDLGWIHQN